MLLNLFIKQILLTLNYILKKEGDYQVGYNLECNIIVNYDYDKWSVKNFICEIDNNFNVIININLKK
jgi:hypothetical protein